MSVTGKTNPASVRFISPHDSALCPAVVITVCIFLGNDDIRQYMKSSKMIKNCITTSVSLYRRIVHPATAVMKKMISILTWQMLNGHVHEKNVSDVVFAACRTSQSSVISIMAVTYPPELLWKWVPVAAAEGSNSLEFAIRVVGVDQFGELRWKALENAIAYGHVGIAVLMRGKITHDDRRPLEKALKAGLSRARAWGHRHAVCWVMSEMKVYRFS